MHRTLIIIRVMYYFIIKKGEPIYILI